MLRPRSQRMARMLHSRWEMTRSTIQSALLNSIGTAQVFSEHLRGHNAVDILRDAVAVPVGMRTRCCKDHKPCKGNKWCGKVTSKRNLLLSRQSQPHLEYEHIRPSYHARLLSKPSKTIDLSSPCGDRPNCEHLAKKDHWILRQNDNNVKTATDIKSIYYILPLLRPTVSEQSGRMFAGCVQYSKSQRDTWSIWAANVKDICLQQVKKLQKLFLELPYEKLHALDLSSWDTGTISNLHGENTFVKKERRKSTMITIDLSLNR